MHRYQPGTTVAGHYTITGLLGSGGTSSVYRARDALMNRTVAIKILDKDNARLSARGFSVESRAAAVLSHPNIVNVYDILDTSDEKYIIMEYIYGITLREYLDHHGHLSVKESISFNPGDYRLSLGNVRYQLQDIENVPLDEEHIAWCLKISAVASC